MDPNRAAIGDDRLAAGAVALVSLIGRLGPVKRVAQMQIHLGAHRELDDGLVERQHQVLNLGRRHGPLDQLVQQFLRQFRQRPAGRCLTRYGLPFLLHWHIHDFYTP
ncbi:hypothetical protein B1M_06860 [Burkholderia sp. TJI49]|nr:hypothetical protein B1M_06860 [Burkholderia sp. TJI49]